MLLALLTQLLIALKDSVVSGRRHEKTIRVVNIPVQYLSIIIVEFVYHIRVIVLHRHCSLLCIEYARLIHVDPKVVDMAASSESVGSVHTLPVFSRLAIKEVNPSRLPWPTPAEEDLTLAVMHEKRPVRLRVDRIVLLVLYLRVGDYNKRSICLLDLPVHLVHCINAEPLHIVNEVLKVCCVRNIHPEDIDWEVVSCEVAVPVSNHLRVHFIPLAEMESKTVDRWQRCESCDFC